MSLFKELKRRNVIRVAAAYLIIGWLLAQVSTTLEDALNLPPWFDTLVVTLMLIGFPITLIIAWVYELTPDGIKKEKDIKSDDSITSQTGEKLDYITIVATLAVAGMFVWQQLSPPERGIRVHENDKVVVEKNSVIPAQAGTSSSLPENSIDSRLRGNDGIVDKSIAVLPFENRSPDPNDAYFTAGIHDDLLTSISKIGAIKTISRTSVMQYKNTTKTIGQIGKELNVATVLEGGVQRAGNRVRINVQLIDVKTDDHLWAQIYDRELNMDNIFEIQTEIAEEIAKALKAQLTPQEHDILSTRPTQSLEAYEAYLLGKQRMETRLPKTLAEALVLFQKAIDLDPKFALAYVGLGDTYLLQTEHTVLDQGISIEKSEKAFNQALELNDQLGEAYTGLGLLKFVQGNSEEAKVLLDKALELSPNYPTVYHRYGQFFAGSGKHKQAMLMLKKGLLLDPLSAIISSNLATSYGSMGQREKAIKQALKTISLEPNNPVYYFGLARRYQENSHELDQSVIWFLKTIEKNPDKHLAYLLLAVTYLEMNDEPSSIKTLNQLHAIAPNSDIEYYIQSAIANFQKDKNKIQKYADLLVKKHPKDTLFWWQLMILDTQAGKHKQVLVEIKNKQPELFEQPLILTNANKSMAINLAWFYQQSSQPEKAIQLLDVLIKSYSDEEKSELKNRVSLMKIYSLQGNKKDFLRLFSDNIERPYRLDSDNTWFAQYRDPIYKAMMQSPEFLKLKAHADKLMADSRARLEKHKGITYE